jgi:CubicO group peptidase (beta-lactamase class C family)
MNTRWLPLVLVLLPAGSTRAARPPGWQSDELVRAAERAAREAQAQGTQALVLAVDVGGELLLTRGFGRTDERREESPDETTLFRVGALLPDFLAVAALRLAERGELELAAPLTRYLPELPYGDELTLDRLLTHTSGLPPYGDLLRASTRRARSFDQAAVLVWLAGGPLAASPGSCASYSSTNDFLLGLVLERTAGLSLPELLQREVFGPAGMEETRWCFEGPALREAAAATQEFAGLLEDQGDAPPPFEAGGLCANARDLVRFQRALVEGRLLGEEGLRSRSTPAQLVGGGRSAHGRGISLTALEELPRESAGGGQAGQRVLLVHYPTMDATVALLALGAETPLEALENTLARTLFELVPPEVLDLPLPAEERARFVGDYYVGCTIYWIAEDGQHLVLVSPEGPRWRLRHQGGARFVAAEEPELSLDFEFEGERPVAFVLTVRGAVLRALRLG